MTAMLYDIRLKLHYDYDLPISSGRHVLRVVPSAHLPHQRLIAGALTVDPAPSERVDRLDFYGTATSSVAIRGRHDRFEATMQARVRVDHPPENGDRSSPIDRLQAEIAAVRTVAPDAPHHFLAGSALANDAPEIAAFARETVRGCDTVRQAAAALCSRVFRDFTYQGEATEVSTTARDAFALQKGVCQDFAHVMISGLRSLDIPAGYVSGFLRTIPPPGEARMEGADAMHAWVRVWCGAAAGWLGFDPTNDMPAGNDHIVVGHGRDYLDVPPILGVLKMSGQHSAGQAVDVIPIDEAG